MKGDIKKLNQDIKETIRKARIHQWEVASAIGISESTLIRWLRDELPEEKRMRILSAVDQIQRRMKDAGNDN